MTKHIALRAVPTEAQLGHVDQQIARKATELRIQGVGMREIATRMNMTESDVAQSITAVLEQAANEMAMQSRSEILALELMRLDKMQAGLWSDASTGNRGSVDTVLKIMSHRDDLMNLSEDTASVQMQTVVIAGEDTGTYVKALDAARETNDQSR